MDSLSKLKTINVETFSNNLIGIKDKINIS
jgi:hypothetical protein